MSRSTRFAARPFTFSRLASRRKKPTRFARTRISQRFDLELLEDRRLLAANVLTDQLDYPPGDTAHIFASGFAVGETVEFEVLHTDGTPNTGGGHEPWLVTDGVMGDFDGDGTMDGDLDGVADGNIHTNWYVNPDDSVNSTFELTASGLTSGESAATTFTDAIKTDYDHFRNKPATAWTNGALQSSNSTYFEGDVVPHWYEVEDVIEGVTYSFNIYYDYYKDLAIDEGGFLRLNTYNVSENPPIAGAAAPVIDNAFPEAGNIYSVKANVTVIGSPVNVAGSTNQRYVTVTFVPNDGDGTAGEEITSEFYWGLQLAKPGDIGPLSKGASSFSGASLQTDVKSTPAIGGSIMVGGGGSLQINPNAVVRGEISGFKFNDLDGDAVKDAGEPGLGDWTIQLYTDDGDGIFEPGAGDALQTELTSDGTDDVNGDGVADPVGYYEFSPLARGTYFVAGEVQQSGWQQTTPNPNLYTITISQTTPIFENQNFGNRQLGAISGIKFQDNNGDGLQNGADAGLAGWTIELDKGANGTVDATTVTGMGGAYSFTGLTAGTYRIREVGQTNWIQTTVNPADVSVTSGTNSTGNNFGNFQLGAISGIKFQDNNGDGLQNGADAGLAGWTIELDKGANGTVDATTVTGAGGAYSFTGLTAGTYRIREVGQTNWIQTTVNPADVSVTSGTNSTGNNFGNFAASPAIHLEKLVNGDDADSVPGPTLAVGSTASFTYEVTNTGNVPLGSVTVVDDNGTPGSMADDFNPTFTGGDTNSNGLLDLSETWTYSANHIVTAGQYTNIGSVSGSVAATGQTATDTDPANHFGSAPAIDIKKLVNGDDANSPTGPVLAVGSTAAFTYEVTNTGNVPLGSVVVVDDNGTPGSMADDFNPTFTGGDSNSNGLLDLTETWTYSASRIVTTGQYTNIGSASGSVAATGQTAIDTDPANHFGTAPSIHLEKLVNGQDADSVPGPVLAVGSTATFTYEVTNIGNVPLGSITVVDNNGTPGSMADDFNPIFTGGDANSNGLLELGETWTFSATHTVTAGQYTNIGTASGSVAATGQTATDTDLAHHFGAAPAISIEKRINDEDADTAPGVILPVGGVADFTYSVSNTGNIALGNIVVTDDNGTPGNMGDDFSPLYSGSGDTNGNNLLEIGEIWTYSFTASVTPGQYTNIGSASGQVAATGQTASDSDPANYFGSAPAIEIIKFVDGDDANFPTGPVLAAGSMAAFTYEVKNTGNVPLGAVVVVDDNGTPGSMADDFNPAFNGGDDNSNGLLDLSETWTFTASHIVTAGQYTNVGSVSGQDSIGQTASDSDPANHFGAAPAIDLKKLVNGDDANSPTGPVLAVGSTASFTYEVINTGNVPLGSVVVVDDNGTPGSMADNFNPTFTGGDTNSNGLLDLNETWTFSASRTVTAGQYTNIGAASGQDSIGQAASDSDAANHFGAAPTIDIKKLVNGDDANSPTGPVLAVGSTASFNYEVTNTGNVPLGSVVVVDDNGTPGSMADDFSPTFTGGDTNSNGLLDLSETWTYTASQIVTAGQYTNIGNVSGSVAETGQTATDSDPANHFGALASIDIEKFINGDDADTTPGPSLPVGSGASFTYVVTNTGNIALSNVEVVDNSGTPAESNDDFNPFFTGGDSNNNGLLDLGETWTYAALLPVVAGQYTNIGTASGQAAGQTATDSDAANYFGGAQAINIEKHVNGQDADAAPGPTLVVGDPVNFTYFVTNVGEITLNNVVVVDDNGTPDNSDDNFSPTFTGGDANSNGLLDIGETWTYTATATVVAGQYTNWGMATATAPGSGQATNDSDPANYFGATQAINIEKHINGDDADAAPGPTLTVGDTVNFTYFVTNAGNIALNNVAVVDDNGTPGNTGDDFSPTFTGGDANNNGLLDIGETWTYAAMGIVAAGQYTNVGTATAGSPDSSQTTVDTDSANYFGKLVSIIVLTPDKGNTSIPLVRVINRDTAKIVSQFYAYEGAFRGGIQVATGDLTGDGLDEIIVAPGQGRVGEVRVFTQHGVELMQFRVQPYGNKYTGGIEVAVGDVNGDGREDIVTATMFGRPDIRVFHNNYNAANPSADAIADVPNRQFFVFDAKFKGGADVIVADMGTFYNGITYNADAPDGRGEIIVGNGPGLRSTVHVFDVSVGAKIVDTILPFNNKFKGGITLSAARVNGDAIPDLIVAAGNGGGSAIEIWSGIANDAIDARLAAFSAFGDQASRNAPVHAAAVDINGDGIADLVGIVQGTNGYSNQKRYFTPNGTLQSVHPGVVGPWNIAALKKADSTLPLSTLYDVPAKDDVYTQIGLTVAKPVKKVAKKK